ncbi:class I SAM-dependent methyltransferase [Candidatus Uhrbacteria bacterium]|nr:class I SAM-dependent methyltransferase [Candidatus Uhrbacteria bacterium]
MDQRIDKAAALANAAMYNSEHIKKYVHGAPHVKHAALRKMYGRMVADRYNYATHYFSVPRILDLGAGEGSATRQFLDLGAKVMAVDISNDQLILLRKQCVNYGDRLETRCEAVVEALRSLQRDGKQFDIVVANSFLHHIPDYLELIRLTGGVIAPHGQFFSFQDPLRYDSLSKATYAFSILAYFCWRIFQGDIIGGIRRRIRRSKGIYITGSMEDDAEYHVGRNGVDQEAIQKLFSELKFDCLIVKYFSTQSPFWQKIGSQLRIKNSFGIIAKKIN